MSRSLLRYPDDGTTIVSDLRPASNDCIVSTEREPSPKLVLQPAPDPAPDNIDQISFDGISASVVSFSTGSFGRLQANALFKNNTGNPVDAQCRIALISGFSEVGFSFIAVDDLATGNTVPDTTRFLEEGIEEGSFDAVRLSGCFTSTWTIHEITQPFEWKNQAGWPSAFRE
ncbi:MAG: hypothetical protein AB8B97_24595 [Granulosicoccus sp.]